MAYDIVPVDLAVKAMRDNGYKNTAYALAELMDNSIQAGAKNVELLCGERSMLVEQRNRSRIDQIAILDDGSGMDADVLRIALQFGNGTRLEPDQATGIGRFGMGLPSASISQCTRVEVWSWTDGIEGALYTYLDLKEITQRRMSQVPEPIAKPIPRIWREIGKGFRNSGTLVVWSNIDRSIWRSARALIENSEFLIGRMYRRFLASDSVRIRMVSFDMETPDRTLQERFALPNDPGYLMPKTSCPEPWSSEAMFQEWGEEGGTGESTILIDFNGKQHPVTLRFSYAKEEARAGRNAGATPHGKHAARNVGVSIVRAGRELDLDKSWTITYDPVERWWGVEIEFPPALDELFGVTNNKQAARNFTELASIDLDQLMKNKSIAQLQEEWAEEQDPKAPLLRIAHRIESNLNVIRRLIKAQSKGKDQSRQRHDDHSPEARGTAATRQRQGEGYRGGSDYDEALPSETRKLQISETLESTGLARPDAELLAASTVDDGLKYIFTQGHLESPAFFSVKPRGGAIIITLNLEHPAYSNLVEVLEKEAEDTGGDELRRRLSKARDGLKLLLEAWARYEDEQPDGKRKSQAQETRVDWGRIARSFLESDD